MAASFFSVAAAVLAGRVAAQQDSDLGYNLLVESANEDVPRTCYEIPELPPSARGKFFIGGPGKFELGGYSFQSYFDAYGKINRFELGDSKACFTAALLNTSYFRHAKRLGRISNGIRFMGTEPKLPACPFKDPVCFLGGSESDNNWVNLFPMTSGKKGLLLTDSPIFLELDYETLEVNQYPWKNSIGGIVPHWLDKFHVPTIGSAHPVLRAGSKNTWVEILSEASIVPHVPHKVAVYTIDGDTMERSLLAHVPVGGVQYMHSFGATKNYVVLPCNLKVGLPTLNSDKGLVSGFEPGWDGIQVVDLSGKIQVFETQPFFHVHIANTFENETGIVMDIGTYQKVPFNVHTLETSKFKNKTERDIPTLGASVERFHLHLAGAKKGKVTRQVLAVPGRQQDFFQVSPYKNGLPYCIYYAVEWFHNDKEFASMAILKHDICRNERSYWHKQYFYPSEAKFIPSGTASDAEDFGVLTFVALNGARQASDFVILNAATMEEIAVVELSVHIPFTAHGQFIPSAAQTDPRQVDTITSHLRDARPINDDAFFQV